MSKQGKGSNRPAEAWMPVRNISNGTVILDNNEKVTGVKVTPRNIFILDEDAQQNVIRGLSNFYNTIDFEFWLIVSDRVVDISLYQSQLQLLYNKTQDQRIRKLISQDMEKGDYFKSNNVVDTEYYLLFKEKNIDNLQKKLRNLINGMASCGLVASQTSFKNDNRQFLKWGKRF